MSRSHIPPDAYPCDPLERFIRWKHAAIEWCVEACSLTPDDVPDEAWLYYYRANLKSDEAGSLMARLIS